MRRHPDGCIGGVVALWAFCSPLILTAAAALVANETAQYLALANDRLAVAVNKSSGAIDFLTLDGQDLLGSSLPYIGAAVGDAGDGRTYGIGPYLDCVCVPTASGVYVPGGRNATYRLLRGGGEGAAQDAGMNASGVVAEPEGQVSYGGIVMRDTYHTHPGADTTGQLVLEQYWFLRDGETGLHTFSRVSYDEQPESGTTATVTSTTNATTNSTTTTPHVLRNLQELRTLFRPNTTLWTHLVMDDERLRAAVPLPVPNPATWGDTRNATTVQDATWYLGDRSGDPYVDAVADYFTKYTFAAAWRGARVHGLFADGRGGSNDTFGAWLVMTSKDTYFGGPLHSDLAVDGIVYNYLVSNHHGAGTPNISAGLDRVFGPQYFYFNRGPPDASWASLRDEALRPFATPGWSSEFYDGLAAAGHLPASYVPTEGRGTWRARVRLPKGARRAVAVLAQNGVDFQDNVADTTAYQYWVEIQPSNSSTATTATTTTTTTRDVDDDGSTVHAVRIGGVKAGTYRLTMYADGIFGDFVQDDVVVVAAGQGTEIAGEEKEEEDVIVWEAESAGTELWRLGTPDKSGGEWRHGSAPVNRGNSSRGLMLPEHRIYFGAYDYVADFPDGVRFRIGGEGGSDEGRDWNYVHWSVFGGEANARRPVPVAGAGEVNNWTVVFEVGEGELLKEAKEGLATLTVQLAAAKAAAGNTDVYNATQAWNDLPLVVVVNGVELEAWVIPYYHSSSCAVRSSVACYQIAHKFVFPTSYLRTVGGNNNSASLSGNGTGTNEIVLSLPYNATDYESAVLPQSVYVQYDALRLEVR